MVGDSQFGPAPDRDGGAPWGVRLQRSAAGLVVAPVGILDVMSAGRLRDVVDSRRGRYGRIFLDLSELFAVEEEGVAALIAWDADAPWRPVVWALDHERSVRALRDAGFEGALPVAPVADAA